MRHVADLVQHQRAAVGRLEQAACSRIAPVNAPFSWPNSSTPSRFSAIALQLIATNGTFAARARLVDRAREQFLAGAALAGDHDARVGARDHVGLRQLLFHRPRCA